MVTPLLPDNWEHLRTHRVKGENISIFIFCAIVPQVSWSSPDTSLLLLLRPWRRSKPRGFPLLALLPPFGAGRSSVESGTIVRRTGGPESQVVRTVRRYVPSLVYGHTRCHAPRCQVLGAREKSGGHTVVVSCPPIVEEGGRASTSSLSSWLLLRLFTES